MPLGKPRERSSPFSKAGRGDPEHPEPPHQRLQAPPKNDILTWAKHEARQCRQGRRTPSTKKKRLSSNALIWTLSLVIQKRLKIVHLSGSKNGQNGGDY